MIPKHCPPTRPGEILLEEFLKPMGITQVQLAAQMGVPIQRVNTLIAGKRDMTAETAVLLARVFGVSPELWLNLQTACDLYAAQARLERALQGVVQFGGELGTVHVKRLVRPNGNGTGRGARPRAADRKGRRKAHAS